MKRTALPVRLVAGFNKVEIKVIAKKILSNYTFVTSKYNQGTAARRCHVLLDCCCKTYDNTVFTSKQAYVIVDIIKKHIRGKNG